VAFPKKLILEIAEFLFMATGKDNLIKGKSPVPLYSVFPETPSTDQSDMEKFAGGGGGGVTGSFPLLQLALIKINAAKKAIAVNSHSF
jgi:hypothetical protein